MVAQMNVMELANDSGITYYGMGKDRAKFIHYLEKFAALVEAAARADEREACAKLVEPTEEHRREALHYIGGEEGVELLDNRAAAIRARGTT
jgi:hypothetical protein